jgi:hypothetical protein
LAIRGLTMVDKDMTAVGAFQPGSAFNRNPAA